MKFFNAVAGNRRYLCTCLDLSERQAKLILCPLLFSFAYSNACPDLWNYLDRGDLILDQLMIDSGAPTVWSKGLHINLDDYAQFINWVRDNKRIKNLTCVSLDVLPTRRDESTGME